MNLDADQIKIANASISYDKVLVEQPSGAL